MGVSGYLDAAALESPGIVPDILMCWDDDSGGSPEIMKAEEFVPYQMIHWSPCWLKAEVNFWEKRGLVIWLLIKPLFSMCVVHEAWLLWVLLSDNHQLRAPERGTQGDGSVVCSGPTLSRSEHNLKTTWYAWNAVVQAHWQQKHHIC